MQIITLLLVSKFYEIYMHKKDVFDLLFWKYYGLTKTGKW